MSEIARASFTSGALFRGQIRRACMSLGLDYQEEKGWLNSYFVVRGDQGNIDQLFAWVEALDERDRKAAL